MGDARFAQVLDRLRTVHGGADAIAELDDEEVIQALAAFSRDENGRDPYLANVLAVEAMNRMHRGRTVARHLAEGVLYVDAENRIMDANPAALALLQRDAAGLRGKDASAVVEAHDTDGRALPPEECPLGVARRTGRLHEGEALFRRADGVLVPVGFRSAPIVQDGEVAGSVTAFHDASERRRLSDRADLLLRLGSRLAATLDHREALDTLATLAVPALADWAAVHVLRPDGVIAPLSLAHTDPTRLEAVRRFHARNVRRLDDPGGVSTVVRTGVPQALDEARDIEGLVKPEEREFVRGLGVGSVLILPLTARGRTFGALMLARSGSARAFDESELAFATDVANRGALAADNAALYAEARELSERLSIILENLGQGVVIVARDGRFTYANGRARDILGIPRGEALTAVAGEGPWGLSDWDGTPIPSYIPGVLETGEPVHEARVAIRHPRTHERRYLLNSFAPLRARDGAVDGVVVSLVDLTERRAIEYALRESRERYRALFDESPDAVLTISTAGNVLETNARARGLTGYEADEIAGRHFVSLLHEEDAPRALQLFDEILQGRPQAAALRVRRKDGGDVEAEASAVPILVEGKVVAVHAVWRDVSHLRRGEALLKRRERQQAVVAELGLAALRGKDLRGLFEQAVEHLARELDVEMTKVLQLDPDGTTVTLRAGRGWQPHIVVDVSRVSAGLESQAGYTLVTEGPVIVRDLAKETRFNGPPLLTSHGVRSGMSVVIHGREKPWGVLGIHTTRVREFTPDDVNFLQSVANVLAGAIQRKDIEDDQERRIAARTRELEGTLRDLQTFTNSVSHDLRAPLRGTATMLDLLLREEGAALAPDAHEFLDRAVRENRRAIALVHDILSFSRSTNEPIRRVRVDVTAIARDIAADLAETHPERGVAWRVAPDLVAHADPGLLRILLYNLLDNAAKYSAKSEAPVVEVSGEERDGRAWIAVRDNGIGFPQSEAAHLFEPFARLSTSRGIEGTGLGLATAHRIVTRHAGEIHAESAPGRGATFRFTLGAPAEAPTPQASGASSRGGASRARR